MSAGQSAADRAAYNAGIDAVCRLAATIVRRIQASPESGQAKYQAAVAALDALAIDGRRLMLNEPMAGEDYR